MKRTGTRKTIARWIYWIWDGAQVNRRTVKNVYLFHICAVVDGLNVWLLFWQFEQKTYFSNSFSVPVLNEIYLDFIEIELLKYIYRQRTDRINQVFFWLIPFFLLNKLSIRTLIFKMKEVAFATVIGKTLEYIILQSKLREVRAHLCRIVISNGTVRPVFHLNACLSFTTFDKMPVSHLKKKRSLWVC